LALDISRLLQPLAERAQTDRVHFRRCVAEEPDHRHRRLLRARRERPCRRAGERGQEFSSFDMACHVTLRLGVIHAMRDDTTLPSRGLWLLWYGTRYGPRSVGEEAWRRQFPGRDDGMKRLTFILVGAGAALFSPALYASDLP